MVTATNNQDVEHLLEEVVQPPPENLNQHQESQIESSEKSTNDKEYNFRQLEKSRDELLQKVSELEKRVLEQKQYSPQNQTEEEEYSLAPDDLVEGKHLKKEIKRLESALQSYQAITIESRLKSQFSDFDSVVSKENIELLKKQEPELASSLLSNPDLYSKGIAAYKMIKNLGLGSTDPYLKEKETVAKNSAKIKSAASVAPSGGNSPLDNANAYAQGLTPELRMQLLKEMEECRKRF
jgi:hypothetical protein